MSKERLPKGFLISTAGAAIKKPGRKDMALIYSERQAAVSGTFTTNKIKGAPVKLCIKRIKSGKGQAIIANSGNSNVCTGQKGMRDAEEMAKLVAENLGIGESLVYVCSTGAIGTFLPMERIRPKIAELSKGLGKSALKDAAKAIMTTDTFPKVYTKALKIGSTTGVISGICKGAGMIYPKMATMLCFLMTDIAVETAALDAAFKDAVKRSFNRITIDGDRSTSDTALIMANGMLGNPEIKKGSKHYALFKKTLDEITYELSKMIVKDGEGATKFVEVEIKGANSQAQAEKGAFAVANSNLFKTAVHGNDANWGRIMAALGSSGIDIKEEKTDIYYGKVKVAGNGVSLGRDAEANKVLKGNDIKITVDLKSGGFMCKVLTCDLSEDYVRVNAEYRT